MVVQNEGKPKTNLLGFVHTIIRFVGMIVTTIQSSPFPSRTWIKTWGRPAETWSLERRPNFVAPPSNAMGARHNPSTLIGRLVSATCARIFFPQAFKPVNQQLLVSLSCA